MKPKQIIFAVLICLMSAFAIITAVLGQSETRIIKFEDNTTNISTDTIPVAEEVRVTPPSSETVPTPEEIIVNSTTTDDATTTE